MSDSRVGKQCRFGLGSCTLLVRQRRAPRLLLREQVMVHDLLRAVGVAAGNRLHQRAVLGQRLEQPTA